MKPLDEALKDLRKLAEETGAERVEVTIRRDGRIYLSGGDGCGISHWWVNGDLLEESDLPSASKAVEMVRCSDPKLGAGRPRKQK